MQKSDLRIFDKCLNASWWGVRPELTTKMNHTEIYYLVLKIKSLLDLQIIMNR